MIAQPREDSIGHARPGRHASGSRSVLRVRVDELSRLDEKIQATQALQKNIITLRQRLDSVLVEKEAVKDLVKQLQEKGNRWSQQVEILGSDIVSQGLALARLENSIKEDQQALKSEGKPEKKVVRRGRQMGRLERITRWVDGLLKTGIAVSP